uniref:Uncharacterized protein n=1 Tax=Oryza sativa subsp. japonica TaxID=39947 RepID=Q6K3C8_ORYSJ|nr:hypothetical protein [Oryza sativa Japonica Group]
MPVRLILQLTSINPTSGIDRGGRSIFGEARSSRDFSWHCILFVKVFFLYIAMSTTGASVTGGEGNGGTRGG